MSGIAKKRVGKDTDAFLQVPVDSPFSPRYNNGNGGGGNMNDKDFVTHTELELSNEKLLRHMDEHFNQLEKKIDANKADTDLKFESINTKFEKQQVWIIKELAATAIFIVTILGFLITILTFVK
ncbi:hypothetical protein [Limosilactobacillus reuteri]|uniref:hypothetical protein n=1 Tax=Limosilactobacillus reuteri TaxID=1598 RepID=UPI003FD61092